MAWGKYEAKGYDLDWCRIGYHTESLTKWFPDVDTEYLNNRLDRFCGRRGERWDGDMVVAISPCKSKALVLSNQPYSTIFDQFYLVDLSNEAYRVRVSIAAKYILRDAYYRREDRLMTRLNRLKETREKRLAAEKQKHKEMLARMSRAREFKKARKLIPILTRHQRLRLLVQANRGKCTLVEYIVDYVDDVDYYDTDIYETGENRPLPDWQREQRNINRAAKIQTQLKKLIEEQRK